MRNAIFFIAFLTFFLGGCFAAELSFLFFFQKIEKKKKKWTSEEKTYKKKLKNNAMKSEF